MMAAGIDNAAAIGQKILTPPCHPWECPPHPLAKTGAAVVTDRRLVIIIATKIFRIDPPFSCNAGRRFAKSTILFFNKKDAKSLIKVTGNYSNKYLTYYGIFDRKPFVKWDCGGFCIGRNLWARNFFCNLRHNFSSICMFT
jgi:hypothetical protein